MKKIKNCNQLNHLWCFFFSFLCCRSVVRSQPCPWTPMERSFGPNTVKCSKPIWKLWEMLKSRMGRGCLWLSKTWAAVKFTPKPFSITPMEGMHINLTVFFFSRNIQIFLKLKHKAQRSHLFVYVCAPGLLWCVEMESTSSTQQWLWETRVLDQLRSLSGHTTHLSKYHVKRSFFLSPVIKVLISALFSFLIIDMPSERATVLSSYLKILRKRSLSSLILELKVLDLFCITEFWI